MTKQRTALITGIHGQDGFYLSRLLQEKGYRVIGLGHRDAGPNWPHAAALEYRQGDLSDAASLVHLFAEVRPAEVYHLAARSFVPLSWKQPVGTFEANALPVIHLLEAIRSRDPEIRFFQASSAQMFGHHRDEPCDEQTPFSPANPYAASKLFAHQMTVNYREAFGLFAVSGILFNHESPRRPRRFVSRRISAGVAAIERGEARKLKLGNLTAVRDWGYAGDFVVGMWLSLQAAAPADYVLSTGEAHSVEDFARLAFQVVGRNWRDYVIGEEDPASSRRNILLGDCSKAREVLGWKTGIGLSELVERMVRSDLSGDVSGPLERCGPPGEVGNVERGGS